MRGDETPGRDRSRRQFLQTAALGVGTLAGLGRTSAIQSEGGDVRWRFETDGYTVTSPTVVDGRIYVGNPLCAVDAAEGTQLWSYDEAPMHIAPAVVDGTVYAATADGLHAVDARLGTQQWTSDAIDSPECSPVVVDGTVYVCSSRRFAAIDAGTGTEQWVVETDPEYSHRLTSLTVADDTAYATASDDRLDSHSLTAIDATAGTEQWHHEFDTKLTYTDPTIANGTVYVGKIDGLTALDATTGTEKWSREGSEPIWSVTVADATVYSHSEAGLQAFAAETGAQNWVFETQRDHTIYSPTVANGTVFASTDEGFVYAVDGETGDRVWRAATGESMTASSVPIVVDGILYAPSATSVYALDAGIDGSSDGSRTRLGTLNHHDEWIDTEQEIQIHREPTDGLGSQKLSILGAFGFVTGLAVTRAHLNSDRCDKTEASNDERDQGA